MSDITSSRHSRLPRPDDVGPGRTETSQPAQSGSQQRDRAETTGGAASGVPEFRMTGSLVALQQLVTVSETVPAALARQAGLSNSELHSLRHLMRGPMGPVELAKQLGVTSAASSGIVDRLCGHGHAERRPHAGDGRRTEVVITDSGRAEVTKRMRPMFEALADLDNSLTDDERVVIEGYLRGATQAMRALIS
ncbi:MarR family winged helix-turn-helix transcriptional regulator [Humibacillus sp. DSM 29435]|uniref:MarR family winged helix-turn-helix transcriptional regulator n=1 Tax=Humibacillus sp. DSM 29435 TaxID=1869167 RepID=UPI0020C766AF|nr:MarR family transcriptional regulator [Humibacillus sp. DSM 29435]